MEARFCAACGTAIPSGVQFCPQCGARVVAPVAAGPAASAPPPATPPQRSHLIWVPIALIAIALLGWAVLAGLPFRQPQRPKPLENLEVVREAPPPAQPPVTNANPPVARAVEIQEVEEERAEGEAIGEEESMSILRSYIGSRGEYGATSDCVSITSEGYRNRGYTLNALNRCDNRSLGRWRVDTLTGKVYRQRRDGRFLDP